MQQVVDMLTNAQAKALVAQVEQPFKAAPHLPKSWTGFLAQIAPYLVGLGAVLSVIGGLSSLSYALGMNTTAMWMNEVLGFGTVYFLVMAIFQLASAGLSFLAFKPLQARKLTGWMLMYWNMILGLLSSVVGVVLGAGIVSSLIGTAIGASIGFYILFEMKREYK